MSNAPSSQLASGHSGFLNRFNLFAICMLFPSAFAGPAFGAPSSTRSRASAASIAGGNAQLNGAPLAPGATLYPGDVITLGAGSTAALQFQGDLVLAAPMTELTVEPSGVGLRQGSVQVRLGGGYSFAVSGPFFRVNVASAGGTAGSAEVRVGGTRAQVTAVAGTAEVTPNGVATPYRLHAGQVAMMDSAGSQAGLTPSAGQISRLLPEVQIRRGSMEQVASAFVAVYWNDELRSGPSGRARVSLNDGSLLNLGSNSVLNVVQHDAPSQQTALDLAIGRMRGRVMKLARPGSKFEVRTPVGVAGLVGTDFYLLVTQDYAELIVFEGAVQFTTLSGQAITATAGMLLRISSAGEFQGPRPATTGEILEAQNSTDIPEIAQQRQQSPKAFPLTRVWIGIIAGAAATGIGVALAVRGPVSPMAP
jgi:ferric-dicitrate binding protein FerR (iron transport regulator)